LHSILSSHTSSVGVGVTVGVLVSVGVGVTVGVLVGGKLLPNGEFVCRQSLSDT